MDKNISYKKDLSQQIQKLNSKSFPLNKQPIRTLNKKIIEHKKKRSAKRRAARKRSKSLQLIEKQNELLIQSLLAPKALAARPQTENVNWKYCKTGDCFLSSSSHVCTWTNCFKQIAIILENMWQKDLDTGSNHTYEFQRWSGLDYYTGYLQINKLTKRYRKLYRHVVDNNKVPSILLENDYWKTVLFTKIPYARDAKEGELTTDISYPYRIQLLFNATTYRLFECFLQTRNLPPEQLNVQILYHGYGNARFKDLLEHGCLESFSKRSVHGKGCYFTSSFEVCKRFYTQTIHKPRGVLICLVYLGNTFKEPLNYTWDSSKPPVIRKNDKNVLIDSVSFAHEGTTAYVVPRGIQVYPFAHIEWFE